MLGRGPWSPVSACRCRPVGPRYRGSMASEPRRSQAIEKERNFLRKAASDNSTARVMDQLKTERETDRQTDRDRSSSPYTVHLCLVVRGPGIARHCEVIASSIRVVLYTKPFCRSKLRESERERERAGRPPRPLHLRAGLPRHVAAPRRRLAAEPELHASMQSSRWGPRVP